MIVRLKIVDRKNPELKLHREFDFKDDGQLQKYIKDMRRMKYKVELLYKEMEDWERYANHLLTTDCEY